MVNAREEVHGARPETARSQVVVRRSLAEEPVALALFDERTCLLRGQVRGNGTQDQVHRLQQRGPHEELLQLRPEVADHFLGEVLVEMALGTTER